MTGTSSVTLPSGLVDHRRSTELPDTLRSSNTFDPRRSNDTLDLRNSQDLLRNSQDGFDVGKSTDRYDAQNRAFPAAIAEMKTEEAQNQRSSPEEERKRRAEMAAIAAERSGFSKLMSVYLNL